MYALMLARRKILMNYQMLTPIFVIFFVMDAFGAAHRAQASTEGVIRAAIEQGKQVCSGNLLTEELNALSRALDNPAAPVLAIVGGSKVSTKLDVLTSLAQKCDSIVVGGGIANTFFGCNRRECGCIII